MNTDKTKAAAGQTQAALKSTLRLDYSKTASQRNRGACESYDALKTSLAARALTPREYEAACRKAARLVGV